MNWRFGTIGTVLLVTVVLALAQVPGDWPRPVPPHRPALDGTSQPQVFKRLVVGSLVAHPEPPVSADVENIREAVLLYLFNEDDSGIKGRGAVYCVGIIGLATDQLHDPSQQFLRRFRLHLPRVVPYSHCGSTRDTGVFEISTRRQALRLTIGPLQRTSFVTAQATYHAGPDYFDGYPVFLEKQHGRWVVDRFGLHGVS